MDGLDRLNDISAVVNVGCGVDASSFGNGAASSWVCDDVGDGQGTRGDG